MAERRERNGGENRRVEIKRREKFLGEEAIKKGEKRDAQTRIWVSRDASDPVSTRSKRVNDSDARRSVAKRPRHDELTFPGHGANRGERWALNDFAEGILRRENEGEKNLN